MSILAIISPFTLLYYVLYYAVEFLQTDEDPAHAYIQTFVLKPIGTSFYVQHDVFRLALHDCV